MRQNPKVLQQRSAWSARPCRAFDARTRFLVTCSTRPRGTRAAWSIPPVNQRAVPDARVCKCLNCRLAHLQRMTLMLPARACTNGDLVMFAIETGNGGLRNAVSDSVFTRARPGERVRPRGSVIWGTEWLFCSGARFSSLLCVWVCLRDYKAELPNADSSNG